MLSIEEDLFLTSNLPPKLTGLPLVVWISPRGNARHDVRVKVSQGPRTNRDEFVTIAVGPEVKVIDGELEPHQLALLTRWIELNRDVLVRFGTATLSTPLTCWNNCGRSEDLRSSLSFGGPILGGIQNLISEAPAATRMG